MRNIIDRLNQTIMHINALNEFFIDENNFDETTNIDFQLFSSNSEKLSSELNDLEYKKFLYDKDGRQMILSDLFEYIFLGRIYYSVDDQENRNHFIKAILLFVNLLMCFESLTFSDELRVHFIEKLVEFVPEIYDEAELADLSDFRGTIGIPNADADKYLSDYFDTLLPKTAGGLWH